MFVWISPARLRAKHWNIPVSSGRRPLICRLPPTNTLYLGIFTGLMGTASLYHTMSGCGVPAQEGEDYSFFLPPPLPLWPFCSFYAFCSFTHATAHRKKEEEERKALTTCLTGDIHHLLHLRADVSRWLFDKHRILCFRRRKAQQCSIKATHTFFFFFFGSLCPSRQQHELHYCRKRWQQNDLLTWSLARWCNIWII